MFKLLHKFILWHIFDLVLSELRFCPSDSNITARTSAALMTQRDASAHICHYEQIYKEVAFIRRPDVQLWRQQRLRGNVPALPTGVRSEWNRELLFSLVHTAQMGTCRQVGAHFFPVYSHIESFFYACAPVE